MSAPTARHARASADSDPVDALLTALGYLLGWVVRAVFVVLWWALLFPMISGPIALAIAASVRFGTSVSVIVAAVSLCLLGAWKAQWPSSFRRCVTGRARVRFLRWFRYRRRWARRLTACKLTDGDADALYVPHLRSVQIGEHIDRVRVRMLEGQSPEDYHVRAVRLAHAFGAQECRPIDAGPAVVELVFRHGDPLADTIPLPDKHPRTLPRHRTTGKDAA
ncbi:hypothetical protein [Nocardia sp. NPDC056100]|uniref:hypothetical protein n=1 Tax=Nocardia sp. NPDC056100 TaxID=3345712 RepID=UPI0035E30602